MSFKPKPGVVVALAMISLTASVLLSRELPNEMADLLRGLSLRASFDERCAADFAIGSPVSPSVYRGAPGHIGNAFDAAGKESVSFQSEVNLDLGSGSLGMWLRPDWETAKGDTQILTVRDGNMQLSYDPRRRRLVFMTGRTLPGEDFRWDSECAVPVAQLPRHQWTHVGLTWDAASGEKRLYVNGLEAARSVTPLIRRGTIAKQLQIGGPGVSAVDELLIWSRPISPEEMRRVAIAAKQVSLAAATLKMEADAAPWAVYPELSKRDYEDAVLTLGQTFTHHQSIKNDSDERRSAKVTFRLLDHRERLVGEPVSQTVSLDAGKSTQIQVPLRPDRLGIFKVEVTVEGAESVRRRDTCSFAVLPPGQPPSDRFFGGHINANGPIARASRKLGFATNRVHNMTQFTWWVRMEPQPNEFAMHGMDQYRSLNALGFEHLGQWFGTPHYATDDPEAQNGPRQAGAYPFRWVPNDEDAIRRYVREAIKRFPEITRWEMWNEPYVPIFWGGSPEQYAQLCRIMSDEARKARPDLKLFIQVNHQGPWTGAAFADGILDTCDGVAYHSYLGPDTTGATAEGHIASLRQMISEKTDRTFEIIHSEGAVGGSTFLRGLDHPEMVPESRRPPLTAVEAGAAYVRTRTVMRASGVTQDFYYFMHPQVMPPRESYSMFDVTNTPKPKAVAAAIMARQLENARLIGQLNEVPTGVRVYEFERGNGERVAIAWIEQGASLTFESPMAAIDLMGNEISGGVRVLTFEPVYLTGKDLTTRLAAGLQGGQITAAGGSAGPPETSPAGAPSAPFEVAAELGEHRLIPISLAALANRTLGDNPESPRRGWTAEGPFNDARMINPGAHQWLGVPFLVGNDDLDQPAVIVLKSRTVPDGPESADIPVGRTARGVFFAHASTWAAGRVGTYRVSYRDGRVIELPVQVGENIDDWWQPRQARENSRVIAFRHPSPLEPAKPNRFVRVWYWENPHPNVPIESITAVSSGNSNLVLLGLTLAVW